MKKNIKEMKKEIFKLMKGDEFSSYYFRPVSTQSMEKKKFKKLVKKISKKYNVIVVLNRDKVLIHDIHTDMYEMTNSKNLARKYDNILIEDDTVVLVHSGRQSEEFGLSDGLALFNNFIHKDKFNTKVLFYSIEETSDDVFCPYLLDKLLKYKKHNKKMYKKYPDFLKKINAYKNKYLNSLNLFFSYIERFTENSRYELLKELNIPDANIDKFELENFGAKQITNVYDLNNMNEDLFDGFIVELFENMFYVTHNDTFAAYLTTLYSDVCWKLLYGNTGKNNELRRIDCKMDLRNKTVTIYEKINIKDDFDDYEIGDNATFTFDELYDMIINCDVDHTNKDKEQKSLVLEKETTVSTTVDDITNLNLNFPLETDRKRTNIENFFIIMEKMVYKVFKDDYTINKMDEIHNSFFKRKSSVRYLFTRKISREMRDEYINSAYLSILFEKCIFGGDMLQDFITDILYILSSYHDSNINHLSAKEIRNQAFVGFKNTFQSENEIQIEMINKANDLDFKKFSMSVDEIQEIVNDVLSK